MNSARMTEGAIDGGHGGIRRWQQGGSNSIQMPDGRLCPAQPHWSCYCWTADPNRKESLQLA